MYFVVTSLFFTIVPTPVVMVIAPSTQTVGQPLTLECIGATVRGITSRVNIVWRRGNSVVRNTHRASTRLGNSLVYTDFYTISPLSTSDEGVVYECRMVIHTNPQVEVNDTVKLNVTGKCFIKTLEFECSCSYLCSIVYPLGLELLMPCSLFNETCIS